MDFSDIDHYPRRQQVADFLSTATYPVQNALRWADYLGLRGGSQVLDIGCGTGETAATLAKRVAPGGRIVGVDKSFYLLERARQTHGEHAALRWMQADAASLPFPENAFDVCRFDRVLSHLDNTDAALDEAARVLARNGWLFVCEYDYAGIAWHGPDDAVPALLDQYRRALRTPDIAASLTDRLERSGWQILVHERVCLEAKGIRAGLAVLALMHWLRQALAAGRIELDRLRGARAALRVAAREGRDRLELPILTCLAKKP